MEACVHCLRIIIQDFNAPSHLPEAMSARYRMCTTLANAVQVSILVLEIVFESVQQKHLDKTIFDEQVVNFVWKKSKSREPVLYPFRDKGSNPLGHDCS